MPVPGVEEGIDWIDWFVKGGGWAAFLIALKCFKYLWDGKIKEHDKIMSARDKVEEKRADTCNKILAKKDGLIEKVYEDSIADTKLTIKTVSVFNERSEAMIKTIDELRRRLENE